MLVIDDYSELVFLETFLKKLGFDVLSLNKDSAVNDALLSFMPELVFAVLKGRTVDGIRLAARLKKLGAAPKVALLNPAGHAVQLGAEQKAKIDALVETPINPKDAIMVVAQLMKLDAQVLLDKLEKFNKARNMGEGGMVFVKNEDSLRDGASIRRTEVRGGSSVSDAGGAAGREGATRGASTGNESVSHGATGGYGRDDVRVRRISSTVGTADTQRTKRYDEIVTQMTEPVDAILPHETMAQAIRELTEASRNEEPALAEINRQKREFVLAMLKKTRRS